MRAYNLLGHKNQFIITDWDASYFQSYATLICKVVAGDLGDNLIWKGYRNLNYSWVISQWNTGTIKVRSLRLLVRLPK